MEILARWLTIAANGIIIPSVNNLVENGDGIKQSQVRRYHTQQYVNGTACDLNNRLRRTEVRFVCEEGSADYISRLDEPETCVYIMTVHTMKICHHPFLKSPTPTKTVTITCNPLLTVLQYQEYLDELEAKEERERLEREKREKEEEEMKQKEEEEKRIKEEKAKYYQENQLKPDIRIFVHHLDEVTSLEVNPAETVLSVKLKLEKLKSYPVGEQVLMYEGKIMKNWKTLAENNIERTASLVLALTTDSDIPDIDDDDDDDVSIEDEDKLSGLDQDDNDGLSDEWTEILKAAQNGEVKTVFKVVESSEDLKKFLKESVDAVKKMEQDQKKALDNDDDDDDAGINDDDEDDEKLLDKMRIDVENLQTLTSALSEQQDKNKDSIKDDIADDAELEELDNEIKTLKERYKNRRDKLTDIKKRVRASMNEQYAQIVKEAKEELAADGIDPEEEEKEDREAIKQLTKTIDHLISKLFKTEKEIESVDKELEQFAEYDSEEKVKSIPPVKGTPDTTTDAKGPTRIVPTDNRVKVRVSRLKGGGKNDFKSDVKNKQVEELEKSVQKELEKAGLTSGDKIQVKIITAGYAGDDDETLHELSEQESETFRNMIVDMIGGHSEVDREQKRQDQQEENYSFVWGENKHLASASDDTDLPHGDIDSNSDLNNNDLSDETETIQQDSETKDS
ncbi:Protein OS-9 [Mactra antiquata]